MSFKKGDIVRLKKNREHEIRQDALDDIIRLSSYGIFTIDKVIEYGHKYIAKEFSRPWKWRHCTLELIKKGPFIGPLPEPINNRFEILDL